MLNIEHKGTVVMSIFGSIMSKILGHSATPTPAPVAPTPAAADPFAEASTPASAPIAAPPVDVGAMLADLAAKSGQPSNYKTSIADLMKLLGLDYSLESRKMLATELHYPGDMNDSASMNIWLHRTVMQKLAENGGIVPPELHA